MDMSGEYVIPAPRKDVWVALNDPEILKQCIPGCESVNKTSDTEFEAKVTAKVGPVRAKFTGKVTLSDINPPNGYTISGEGSGGAAGFAKGGAKVSLSDDPEGTKLSYSVDATVGGKLAQIGSRLIDSTAKKMANDFGTFADLVMAFNSGRMLNPNRRRTQMQPSQLLMSRPDGINRLNKRARDFRNNLGDRCDRCCLGTRLPFQKWRVSRRFCL